MIHEVGGVLINLNIHLSEDAALWENVYGYCIHTYCIYIHYITLHYISFHYITSYILGKDITTSQNLTNSAMTMVANADPHEMT